MAIDTTNEKLALMEWDNVWEPAIPISPGAFGQDDKQQLLWGYPGILWTSETFFGYGRNAALVTRRLRAAVPPRKTRTAVVARRERAKTSEQN